METATEDPCPGEQEILDFVQGNLSGQAPRIEAHLDRCAECRRVVSELAKSSLVREAAPGSPDSPTQAMTEVSPAAATAPIDELRSGTRVGRFTILELCGVGGMGVVYAAHDPDLDRKVAIKLLRAAPEAGSSEGRARLMREAQAMARLSHPNVISVYEVGTYEELVFVAMEFVDGGTLNGWRRGAKRTWREVIEMYGRAGRGLAAAHAAGLVHRDFKPDNVLCGADGRVRVTDFGLARVAAHEPQRAAPPSLEIAGDAALDETLTRTGALLGTPAYMPPEQYEGRGSTALGDQFSFCVALHEALYGERPFAGRTIAELREAVSDGRVREPPGETRVPAWVRKILLRGLSVDPAARHPSMDALLAQLGRDPAVRRRRVALGAAAIAVLASVAVAVWVSVRDPGRVCRGAEDRLAGVWDRARRQAMETAFMKTEKPYAGDAWRGAERLLDGYATAWTAMRTEACLATRVDGGQSDAMLGLRMACLDRRLAELDALARLYEQADADVIEHAVSAAEALPPLKSCAAAEGLLTITPPPSSRDGRARVEAIERKIAEARALYAAGKYADARPRIEAQVNAARELGWKPLLAQALSLLAQLDHRMGGFANAERHYYEALWAAESSHDDQTAANAWIEIYYIKSSRDEVAGEEEERLRSQAEAALERAGGDDDLLARLLDARGQFEESRGAYETSLDLALQAKALRERRYPPGARVHVHWMMTIGAIYFRMGRFRDATEIYTRAVETTEGTLGPDHPDVALGLNMVATAKNASGQWEESIALHERALRIQERSLGGEHPQLGTTLHNMAIALDSLGRHDQALALELRALAIFERAFGKNNPRVASSLGAAANAYMSKGDYATARTLLERALQIVEAAFGPEHRDVAMVLTALASCDQGEDRNVDAIARYRRALAIQEKLMGANHPHVAVTLANLGELYVNLEEWGPAADVFRRALEIDEAALGGDHPGVSYDLSGLGRAYVGLGQPAKAIPLLERAIEIRSKTNDPYQLADAKFRLAMAIAANGGDRKRARALATEARAAFAADPSAGDDLRELDAWMKRVTR